MYPPLRTYCGPVYFPPLLSRYRGGEIKSQLRRRVQNRNLTTLYESLGNHETLYESRDQLARVPRTLGNGDLINTYHEEICQAIE